jgi:NADPH-dependent 2,4-dienoyl-CoA reductase/sulfur reductase-like enzyme
VADRVLRSSDRCLVIGAGFMGAEVASVCRELGLAVTVASSARHRSSA